MNKYNLLTIALLFSLTGCSIFSTPPQLVTLKNLETVGNHAGLIQYYKHELAETPDSKETMLNLAQSYYNNNDMESATFYAEKLKTDGMKDARLDFLMGNLASERGDFTLAISEYQAAIVSGYTKSDLFINLGAALTNTGQYGAAEFEFNQARLKGHDDASIKNNLAVLHMAQGQYLEAVALLSPVHETYPDAKKITFNLAISLFKMGDYAESSRLLREDYSDEQIYTMFQDLRNGENKI